jgi:hypothetical protein
MALSYMALLVMLGALVGLLGSVFGLGGGIFIIPALVLYFRMPMHFAIATSLITIIATSSAVASVNVESGLANMRLGMSLEVATTLGAMCGAFLATMLSPSTLQLLFSILLCFVSITMLNKGLAALRGGASADDVMATDTGELGGEYVDPATGKTVRYHVRHMPVACVVSVFAGAVSGLLGIGGGIIKVPLMHLVCEVPMKAAAATSNFMLGVTAATSALVFYSHGVVHPRITALLVFGVLLGSRAGMKLLGGIKSEKLQLAFGVIVFMIAVKMFMARGMV